MHGEIVSDKAGRNWRDDELAGMTERETDRDFGGLFGGPQLEIRP